MQRAMYIMQEEAEEELRHWVAEQARCCQHRDSPADYSIAHIVGLARP
jgi:hypothetical protein